MGSLGIPPRTIQAYRYNRFAALLQNAMHENAMPSFACRTSSPLTGSRGVFSI